MHAALVHLDDERHGAGGVVPRDRGVTPLVIPRRHVVKNFGVLQRDVLPHRQSEQPARPGREGEGEPTSVVTDALLLDQSQVGEDDGIQCRRFSPSLAVKEGVYRRGRERDDDARRQRLRILEKGK